MIGDPRMRDPAKPPYFYALRRGQFAAAAKLLGWSRVTVAERLRTSERTARRWLDGETLVPERELRWIQAVARAVVSAGEFPEHANDAG